MKIFNAILVIVFSSVLYAKENKICNSEIDVEVLPRDQSIDKEIVSGKEKRTLAQAKIFLGHPKNLSVIRPIVNAKSEEVVEFPSPNNEQIWAVCWYGDRKIKRLKVTINLKQPTQCRFKSALVCNYK